MIPAPVPAFFVDAGGGRCMSVDFSRTTTGFRSARVQRSHIFVESEAKGKTATREACLTNSCRYPHPARVPFVRISDIINAQRA